MSIIRPVFAALFAVLVFSVALVASSASAHPLFLTESGKELLVSGHGGVASLRLSGGVTLLCELVLIHGFVLNRSPLIHRLRLLFEGKCELHSPIIGLVPCTEPIHWRFSLGELGLVLGNKTVGILVAPSEGGLEFLSLKCGINEFKLNGAFIGEVPEKVGLTNQYNKPLSAVTSVFEAEGKNSTKQAITAIELLGVNMTGVKLETTGFIAGEASEETTLTLEGDGKIEICTKAESACP